MHRLPVMVEAGESTVCSTVSSPRPRAEWALRFKSKGSWLQNPPPPCSGRSGFVQVGPSTDWARPTPPGQGNWLRLQSTGLNGNLIQKQPQRNTQNNG